MPALFLRLKVKKFFRLSDKKKMAKSRYVSRKMR